MFKYSQPVVGNQEGGYLFLADEDDFDLVAFSALPDLFLATSMQQYPKGTEYQVGAQRYRYVRARALIPQNSAVRANNYNDGNYSDVRTTDKASAIVEGVAHASAVAGQFFWMCIGGEHNITTVGNIAEGATLAPSGTPGRLTSSGANETHQIVGVAYATASGNSGQTHMKLQL